MAEATVQQSLHSLLNEIVEDPMIAVTVNQSTQDEAWHILVMVKAKESQESNIQLLPTGRF